MPCYTVKWCCSVKPYFEPYYLVLTTLFLAKIIDFMSDYCYIVVNQMTSGFLFQRVVPVLPTLNLHKT